MKQPLQTTLLGFSISLILSSWVSVNADTIKTTASQVNYGYYYYPDSSDYLKNYHGFLLDSAPEELYPHVRMKAAANIDDTPEKETIVLTVVGTKPSPTYGSRSPFGNWHQAFLLITGTETAVEKRKDFFKIFDTGTYALDAPTAKPIELHRPPFVLKQPADVSFRLVDLTGDGTLDVWVESVHGVALISFENGEFREVFSDYTVTREKFAETADVEYHSYDASFDPEGQMYHRFLPAPPPKRLYYDTQMTATANIDDTPEKETIVLMTAETGREGPRSESVQAFLLIAETEADVLKKKDFFKLSDAWTYDFDTPGKTIKIQSAPFVLKEVRSSEPWSSGHLFFRLVDLTGDGILDIWIQSYDGVAVISFQNGEFKEVCSVYSSFKREDPIEYIDLDNDGIYEIKIPTRISVDGVPTAAYPEWVSLYEWDGTTYVLNNERFHAENDEILNRSLRNYKGWPQGFGKCEEQRFYIGLIYYYRSNAARAREFLQWVVENGKKQDYIQAAEDLLKKLPPTEK